MVADAIDPDFLGQEADVLVRVLVRRPLVGMQRVQILEGERESVGLLSPQERNAR